MNCAVCGFPVDDAEAHYPHRDGCLYLEPEVYVDCDCSDAVHPECCAECEL